VAELSHLPPVLQDVWSWQYDGACRGADPRIFFHPEGARGPSKAKRESLALAYCRRCPVLRECREQAIDSREMYGVWGGLTEEDREHLRADRRRTVPAPSLRETG
jgi:WhiB family redox-sensing transcriptional regulator